MTLRAETKVAFFKSFGSRATGVAVRVAALITLVGSGACRDTTAPVAFSVDVSVADTVVATTTSHGDITMVRFSLPVTVTNTGDVSLRLELCYNAVELLSQGEWRFVWAQVCLTNAQGDYVIPPGMTRTVTVDVNATQTGTASPRWRSERVEGTYRLQLGVLPRGYVGVVPTVPSNQFSLVMPE